jgi:single-strand DNA-binding protein
MSLNKVQLIGNVGQNPEIRSFDNGKKVATLSLATSESWKDKVSGEKKVETQWHKIAIFSQGLVNVVESYISKGSKIYIEGQLQHRKYTDKQGVDKYITEVVLSGYGSNLKILDSKNSNETSFQKDEKEEEFEAIPF